MTEARVWAAIYRGKETMSLLLVCSSLYLLVGSETFDSFGVLLVQSIHIKLLGPVLASTAVGLGCTTDFDPRSCTIRSLVLPRIIWVLVLTFAAIATVAFAALSEMSTTGALTRNVIMFTSLALLGAALFGAYAVWLGPVSYALLSLLIGAAVYSNDQIASWAFVLSSKTDSIQWAVACISFVIATVLYGLRGSHGLRVKARWS